jgi:hypothetical protein
MQGNKEIKKNDRENLDYLIYLSLTPFFWKERE